MREFMHVDDMANASLFVFELDEDMYRKHTSPILSHVNIGTGLDITIRELSEIMREVVDFKGKIVFDDTKPDGSPKKLTDVSRLTSMGWSYQISFREGLEKTYSWYLKNID